MSLPRYAPEILCPAARVRPLRRTLFFRALPSPILTFFGGNLSSVSFSQDFFRRVRRWFDWTGGEADAVLKTKLDGASHKLAACVAAALEKASPSTQLVLGGFSQGAIVALHALTSAEEGATPALSASRRPAGLIQLSAQAPREAVTQMKTASLSGVRLLVAAGTADEIAPMDMGEKVLEACTHADALADPMIKYDGAHEVTKDVADAVGTFIDSLAEGALPVD